VSLDEAHQRKLTRANQLALAWHADQQRRDSPIPYISHLAQVSGLVLEHGGDVDQAIAGLLHDALEDADSPSERAGREQTIVDEFGDDVLHMVADCTDTEVDEAISSKAPWLVRKERHLAHLAEVGERSLLVAACDKRHNLHSLVWDVRTQGHGYLDRFNAAPDQQVWYFTEILRALRGKIPRRLMGELEALLAELEALVKNPPQKGG
jgi:(p)ppGpp synthase/HD superfamily hydrolase